MFGVLVGGYVRSFRDGDPSPTSMDKYDEGTLVAAPAALLRPALGCRGRGELPGAQVRRHRPQHRHPARRGRVARRDHPVLLSVRAAARTSGRSSASSTPSPTATRERAISTRRRTSSRSATSSTSSVFRPSGGSTRARTPEEERAGDTPCDAPPSSSRRSSASLAVAPEPACVSIPATRAAAHPRDARPGLARRGHLPGHHRPLRRRRREQRLHDRSPGRSTRYQGGDWLGIQQHLDYLQALGVTTLWISPVVVNVDTNAGTDGYHGYWAAGPHAAQQVHGRPRLAPLDGRRRARRRDEGRARHRLQPHGPGLLLRHEPERPARRLHRGERRPDEPITQINEYDPDWNPAGVQASARTGPTGARQSSSCTTRRSTVEPPQAGHPRDGGGVPRLRAHPRLLRPGAGAPRRLHRRAEGPGDRDPRGAARRSSTRTRSGSSRWTSTASASIRSSTSRTASGRCSTRRSARASPARTKNNFIMFGEAFDGDDVSSSGATRSPGCSTASFTSRSTTPCSRSVFENAHLGPTQQRGRTRSSSSGTRRPSTTGRRRRRGASWG